MIYGVTAQTGSGKTYFVMKRIIEWLVADPTNQVVTNLAINMAGLCEYLTKEYGSTLDCFARIRILDINEVWEFWRFFGVGYEVPNTRRIKVMKPGGFDMQLDIDGCVNEAGGFSTLFAIDESDKIFDAKAHAKMGTDLKDAMRHQRKFVWDVYFITPNWGFLVKEVRVLCHLAWVMENGQQMKLGRIPFIGSLFRGLPWITGNAWKVDPNGNFGGAREQPREVTRFRIDPQGIGGTYYTAGGFGVKGNQKKVIKAEKVKGLSPMWLGVAGLVIILALVQVPRLLGKAVAKTSEIGVTAYSNGVSAVTVAFKAEPKSEIQTNRVQASNAALPEKEKVLTGIVPSGKGWVFYFSDGSVKTSRDFDYKGIKRRSAASWYDSVNFGGKEYAFK